MLNLKRRRIIKKMSFKIGQKPWNKGKKKETWKYAKIYRIKCLNCGKWLETKREDQVYCNNNCYFNSNNLKLFGKNSKMIKENKVKKYHEGYKHTSETISKIVNHINRYNFPKGNLNPGFNKSKETIEKIKLKRLHQKILKKDTFPERAIHNILRKYNISFIKHKPITDIKHTYQCDIFIEPNIIIECDGNYWHRYPNLRNIDKIRNKELQQKNYVIIRFWEKDIKEDIKKCESKLISLIK